MRNLIGLMSGAPFGLGLWLSGMTDMRKVLGFPDFFVVWGATLVFVKARAILPMALAWRVVRRGASLAEGEPDP